MTQYGTIIAGKATIQIGLPAAEMAVLPGVSWGAIEAFPTPAYWAFQVVVRRTCGMPPRHRLGSTLSEEVAACLLGGHGIPSIVGVSAFQFLRSSGVLARTSTEEMFFELLSRPLEIKGQRIRYRFARQKARYLSAALRFLENEQPPTNSGRALRDWLTRLPGIGLKTASWIARNWLDADDIAILDIHILRAGAIAKFLDTGLSVERNYLELEAQFLRFAQAIGVRASELDAVIWHEMMSSPRSVARLLGGRRGVVNRPSLEKIPVALAS